MKSPHLKSILAVSLALVAFIVSAQDGGNTVGYKGQRIGKGRTVFTTPFTNDPSNGSLAQSIGSLLPSACEGDVIEYNDFKAEVVFIDGALHWVANGLVVDDCILPANGQAITYTRTEDKTTEFALSGEVADTAFPPLKQKPAIPAEVKIEKPQPFFLSDLLSYSTVRIVSEATNAPLVSGTGFFYNFDIGSGKVVPAILTNKHVVRDIRRTRFVFSTSKNGMPDNELIGYTTDYSNGDHWYGHEDSSVDLCYILFKPIVDKLFNATGKKVYCTPYSKEFIPDAEYLSGITQLDDVVMIGYPNGIWDNVNNQPIFRKGSLATRPNKNYMGRREFIIDMPVFGGSSGSPVLLATEMPHIDRIKHSMQQCGRVKLLGVVNQTFLHTATGDIKAVPITTLNSHGTNYSARVAIPNNLGIVISASRILELEETVRRIYSPPAK